MQEHHEQAFRARSSTSADAPLERPTCSFDSLQPIHATAFYRYFSLMPFLSYRHFTLHNTGMSKLQTRVDMSLDRSKSSVQALQVLASSQAG